MNQKLITFKKYAREKLFKGVKLLADVVCTTLSPKGQNVAIQREWGTPIIIHDGVSAAREVASKDPFENMGVMLVKEAASKTNDEVGDGTTTATLLSYELIKGGLKLIDKGVNPMILRTEIYKALPFLQDKIKELSKPIKNKEEIARVATMSSADEEIGKMVSIAMEKVGKDGLVVPEEGTKFETEVDYTEGMQFNKGYLLVGGTPIFVTNPARMEAVVENPAIIIFKKEISLGTEIAPVLEVVAKETKSIVVIAKNITGDALTTMGVNKYKGNINAIAIQAPPADMDNFLDDLAVMTGGKVITTEQDATDDLKWLGHAEKVISDRDTTIIINGKGDAQAVKERVKSIKAMINREKSVFEKEKEEQRLARMTKGVAVIRVGAKTDIDMREKVERVKDAIGAATAAREEGVVAGGGTAFLRLLPVLDDIDVSQDAKDLLKSVLRSPIYKILENCAEKEPDKIVSEVMKKNGNYGYEVNSGKVIDLVENGIIDPSKVIRKAIENAWAVGSSILTTEVCIALDPEYETELEKARKR
jgi:chaperonin GroEL